MVSSSGNGSCVLITAKKRSVSTLLRFILWFLADILHDPSRHPQSLHPASESVQSQRRPSLLCGLEEKEGVHIAVAWTRHRQWLGLSVTTGPPEGSGGLGGWEDSVVFANFHAVTTSTCLFQATNIASVGPQNNQLLWVAEYIFLKKIHKWMKNSQLWWMLQRKDC